MIKLSLFSRAYEKYTISIVICFVLIILFLLGLQGFDVVDEGWYMTFYQQIFHNPESVEYNFAFYLTGIIGGFWYELFPYGGILSFRVLAILCIVSTLIISYKTLANYITKRKAIIGLLMVVFVSDFGYLSFYYNHLSSLLAVLTIFFLLRGISKKHTISLLIAGSLTAINVFSRLPNITLFVFGLIFPIHAFWECNLRKKYWLKKMTVYILGAFIGFLVMFIVLMLLGHIDIMHNAILGILDKGQNQGSNHNIFKLFHVYFTDYKLIIKALLKILVALIILMITKKSFFKNRSFKLIWYLLGIALFVYVFNNKAIYSLYGIGILGCVSVILCKQIESNYKSISLLALMMMMFLPLGSDGGINNVGYVSIWLSFPIALSLLLRRKDILLDLNLDTIAFRLFLKKHTVQNILLIMISSFFMLKMYKIYNEAYFDVGSRFYKRYSINNSLAKGIYTTKERAKIFNELLLELQQHVSKDDYLLAYDKIPMINFLTQTRPYMYNSWVWVYDGIMFKKQLLRAESEISTLPIIVQQKFETIREFSEPDSNYLSEDKENSYRYNRQRVIAMNNFIDRNDYEIIWSNKYFNIYESRKFIKGL